MSINQMSVWSNVCLIKCLFDQMSDDQMSVDQMSFDQMSVNQNVCWPKCLLTKMSVDQNVCWPKCQLVKWRSTYKRQSDWSSKFNVTRNLLENHRKINLTVKILNNGRSLHDISFFRRRILILSICNTGFVFTTLFITIYYPSTLYTILSHQKYIPYLIE